VLDLYAGSGALGIEALSRGALHATFVESRPDALRVLRGNLRELALSGRARVIARSALRAPLEALGPFQLVFADPPYAERAGARILERVAPALAPRGVLALEHADAEPSPDPPETLALWKARRYGSTRVSLYRRLEEGGP
jgi:16S rRNA (guanine966-N2)-methyltransferase